MARSRRLSPQSRRVLAALAKAPKRWRYGYDLCQQTGLKSGAMYPILMRLAERGFLETAWESDPPPGRPPRHLYRITGEGAKVARSLARGETRANAPRPAIDYRVGVISVTGAANLPGEVIQ
jgi:DNA-binding PadR family transcriptional regulator